MTWSVRKPLSNDSLLRGGVAARLALFLAVALSLVALCSCAPRIVEPQNAAPHTEIEAAEEPADEQVSGGQSGYGTGNESSPAATDGLGNLPASSDYMAVEPEPVEPQPQPRASVELTCGMLDDIEATDELQVFYLSDEAPPELNETAREDLEAAVQAIREKGGVGFLFLDVESGTGVSLNIDQAFYGASSFKGPYAVYLCQQLVESGELNLDDTYAVCTQVEKLGAYPYGGSDTARRLIEETVVRSDNNAYASLRDTFDMKGYNEWASDLGANDCLWVRGYHYPTYCARSSAKLWLNAHQYFQSGTDTALWLEGLMQSTEH